MNKLIICDFEKVLINKNEEVPMSTVILIDELRRLGNKFIVITNNSLRNILYYNRDFTFMDYIISCDGSCIYDTNLEKIVYKKNILSSNVSKIVNKFYNDSVIYLIDEFNYNLISNKEYINIDCIKIDDYKKYLNDNKNNIYKIELHFKNKKDIDKALIELDELNLKISFNNRKENNIYIIDIVLKDESLDNAINNIIKKNKVNKDNVIYFGNDINILKSVSVGVVPKNIKLKSKLKVDRCDTSDNKGLEKYLNECIKKV